ncbi:unnamed protein product [Darwinula stevensoni]|uniref:Protein kinase domain-containing protein n=1 Tax=Darwinula stevensoni TaxID=69355 RepID=A0A7R9A2B4_9CRUS|nr:unnamed protein product [Darwinula stevensoni]CAG0879572.1 unnamed protein product [Darwinula stevensoni]
MSRLGAHSSILLTLGYRVGRSIGEGSYSKVRVAERLSPAVSNRVKVACKVIDRLKASKEFATKFLPRELSLIKNLKHPNIVDIYEIVDLGDYVFLFVELCPLGDLLECIKANGQLSERRASHYFRQLMEAIKYLYLHRKNIAHRDLKCENIFLASNSMIKVTDFGFSRSALDPDTGRRVLSSTFCGSAAYAAPELIQGTPYNPMMCDIWSSGCILFIMVCGRMPYDDADVRCQLTAQLNRKVEYPPEAYNRYSSAIQ